ncbi:2-oxoacid:ferredoxin oxidoreductase subunit beta [Tessaracoccus antarcticus]|uniref:2-oxoacid:ferredoxin oxidoreductase subunit beta n=1 Tax=Tessaracoccus antarcticus TaxID=2479848 RepID=A0A3M0GRT4_9ACTN|nr:2-oxoacid:ferredoxin oxidoreductase subunit beta [Tessaracoccus antarcticus]RMB59996.1 2-oxoacid:ferredoxin oxidoreductase subunit beta [Tessaracoccus antarcticus]
MTATHPSPGLARVPLSLTPTNRKEFVSDQEVRWCPGCGDYAVLAAFQTLMPKLGIRRENTVIVSGIGCSSRFPYYMDTYGLHSIHGRAPSIATGLALTRPDLAVWVVTGDGDALSIGGNHLIHALRRNTNITILLFNNRIYGLTKGQPSPTSETGMVTKSSPIGSVDHPFNPVKLALGAEATFVARSLDSDRAHLTDVMTRAVQHRGASLVEIYQNCPIFNDGVFDGLKEPDSPAIIPLRHGEPIVFAGGTRTVVRDPDSGRLSVVAAGAVGERQVVIHDEASDDVAQAMAVASLTDTHGLTQSPIGIFRAVDRPVHDDEARAQVHMPTAENRIRDLQSLVTGHDTWSTPATPTAHPEELHRGLTT